MISETQTLETDGIVPILGAAYQRQILRTPAKDGTTLCDNITSQLLTFHHRASFLKKMLQRSYIHQCQRQEVEQSTYMVSNSYHELWLLHTAHCQQYG